MAISEKTAQQVYNFDLDVLLQIKVKWPTVRRKSQYP